MNFSLLLIAFLSFSPFYCFGNRAAAELNLEEKVGQLLMVHFRGEEANESARYLIQDLHIGAIIYYNWSNGLTSPEQVCSLSKGLQSFAGENRLAIPLLIAVDQEGGPVVRLKAGFTQLPDNQTVGLTESPNEARVIAKTIGLELKQVGINMNLAPVVDINSNPLNPVIGVRSFGNDPEVVANFGKKALEGYKDAQMIAVLKHFPGHGDVNVDSHVDLPMLLKSLPALQSAELLPFARLAPFASVIMTAHLQVPALDQQWCSTLSKKTLDYLKDTIGFKGVILSDSLVMEGVLKQCGSVDEVAIQALNAGCDLLILGGKQLTGNHASLELTVEDIQRIHGALIEAIKSGRVSEARVDQAVEKILWLKDSIPK